MPERLTATDSAEFKYARFLGIEAGLFVIEYSTPFGESRTLGIIPDQTVTFPAAEQNTVVWVQLTDTIGSYKQVISDYKSSIIQYPTK